MPAEPENKMDDLLKTYVKKRRDEAGAPLDLHPATRRLLQAEVAKLRPASGHKPRPWFSAWRVYWPQLTAVASIFVLLGVGYRVLLQEEEAPAVTEQFAKRQAPAAEAESLDRLNRPALAADSPAKAENSQDKSGAFRRLNEVQSTPAPSESRESKDAGAKGGETTIRQLAKAKEDRAESIGGRTDLAGIDQTVTLGVEKKSALLTRNEPAVERDALLKQLAPTGPATPPPAQPSPVTRAQSGTANVKLADELAARAPAVSRVGGPTQAPPQAQSFYRLAGATAGRAPSVGQRQRFTQAPQSRDNLTSNFGGNASQGVLASFEMQQDGSQLRAIDSDGSIYEGRFNEAIEATNGSLSATTTPALQPTQTPANRPAAGRSGSASAVEAAKPGQSGVRFRLSGTNQTLKQLVVFEGMLTGGAPTSAPATQAGATVLSAVDQPRKLPPDAYSTQQGALLSYPIQGTLRIGTSNAVPVQALPVSR